MRCNLFDLEMPKTPLHKAKLKTKDVLQLFHHTSSPPIALFQNEEEDQDESESDDDDGSSTDHFNTEKSATRLQRCEHQRGVNSSLPDTFQTSHLLFYERFKAYQDYMLGNFGQKLLHI